MNAKSEMEREAIARLIREVRARIWAWDPVGLADIGAPEDEYDCLVGPVTAALREGLSADDMAAGLQVHVSGHFGVQPSGTEAFTIATVAWYQGSAESGFR